MQKFEVSNGKIIVKQLFNNLSDDFYKKEHYWVEEKEGGWIWNQISNTHNHRKAGLPQIHPLPAAMMSYTDNYEHCNSNNLLLGHLSIFIR